MFLSIFGNLTSPYTSGPLATPGGTHGEGLFIILNSLIKLIIVVASLYAFLNIILAGYGFMSAGGDSKAIGKAWDKIWQSLVGLLVVAGSFVLAVIFGYLIFGPANWYQLIIPQVFSP